MALTAQQQKNLARLATKVTSGQPLTAAQQKNFTRLTGKAGSPLSAMPTVTANYTTRPMPSLPTKATPAGTRSNMPAQAGIATAAPGKFGPEKQNNLTRLMNMAQSGVSLTPKQQANLTRLQGEASVAAQGGNKKAGAILGGGSSTAGLNFNIPKSLANISAPNVNFSYTPQQVSAPSVDFSYSPQNVAAAAPGMENFDPGTLVDIASKLGLDFGDLTSGLTRDEYLAGQDPSYEFQQQQAQQAIERSAAAHGGALGGGTLKALQDRASQVAALDFQNAYARDLANRQLGLQQVQNEYGNEANTWAQNAGYDVSNRGMDLQAQMANQNAGLEAAGMSLQAKMANADAMLRAGIANQDAGLTAAGMSLQAQLANASNALTARGLAQDMTRAKWDAQLTNRAQNLSALNDSFNRDLAAKNFGLQGLAFTQGMQQQNFNNNMTALGFGADLLNSNRSSRQAGINYGTQLGMYNQGQQTGLMNSWLNNDWTSRDWQTGVLGNLLNTGYGASGSMANNAMNRGAQAGNAAAGYGNAAMQGSLASGAAWGNAMQGVGNAIQGGMGNYMLWNLLGNGTGTGSWSGALGGGYGLSARG